MLVFMIKNNIISVDELESIIDEVNSLDTTNGAKLEKVMSLIDALEDLDDVQNVYHNLDI